MCLIWLQMSTSEGGARGYLKGPRVKVVLLFLLASIPLLSLFLPVSHSAALWSRRWITRKADKKSCWHEINIFLQTSLIPESRQTDALHDTAPLLEWNVNHLNYRRLFMWALFAGPCLLDAFVWRAPQNFHQEICVFMEANHFSVL